MSILRNNDKKQIVITTGDKAIARAALESGIGFFATYPGTPASGIGDSLYSISKEYDWLHCEYSINEKIALEGAIGASLAGFRSMVAMKHLGLNVAADPLHHITNRLIVKNLVIVNGSDPGQQASANEQDNRNYSMNTHMPVLVPSSVQEAKDFTVKAFEISNRFSIPVLVDAPNLLLHGAGELKLGQVQKPTTEVGNFHREISKEENELIGRVGGHKYLLKIEERVRKYALGSTLNKIHLGNLDWGIITSGMSYGFTLETLEDLDISGVPILKLGLVHPLSPEQISNFIKPLKKVIVIEETEGFLEKQIKLIAYDNKIQIPIIGKKVFSEVGMLSTSRVTIDLCKHFDLPLPEKYQNVPNELIENTERLASTLVLPGGESLNVPGLEQAPKRIRNFCAGCPHRGTAYALKKATKGKVLIGGDIGCYNISAMAPYSLYNWHFCMGGGIGIGQGMKHKLPDTAICAMIGDSTFFHSGLPAVVNAVFNKSDVLLIVMDNNWTAMTGHQPSPSSRLTTSGESIGSSLDIFTILKSLGVKWVKKGNPFAPRELTKLIKESLNKEGPKAIVVEGECSLQTERRRRYQGLPYLVEYKIDQDKCKACGICYSKFNCPAIIQHTDGDDVKYSIDKDICNQCGACVQICPVEAICSVKNDEVNNEKI